MTSTFHALELPSGEAFLLKTNQEGRNWTILVDSGMRYAKNNHPLIKAIRCAEPELKHIDIAVCTHQDADHANGFRTFADVWYGSGGSIGEFWLPGRWAAALPDILLAPEQLISKLYIGAVKAADQLFKKWDLEENSVKLSYEARIRSIANREKINKYFSDVVIGMERCHQEEGDEAVARSLGMSVQKLNIYRADLEESEENIWEIILNKYSNYSIYFWKWGFNSGNYAKNIMHYVIFDRAIDTAKSIHAIAKSAAIWSIPIRWFDFGIFEKTKKANGGKLDLLEPVNSVELIRPPMSVDEFSLLLCLTLTRQNVESLVFYRPETEYEPAVMFLADSRLAFGVSNPRPDFPMPRSKPTRPILITAPHHGSQVNDHAYSVIDDWLGSNLKRHYVRNGGHHKQKLGKFLGHANRRCAQCSQCHGRKWKQRVSVHNKGSGDWIWPSCTGIPCLTPKRCAP